MSTTMSCSTEKTYLFCRMHLAEDNFLFEAMSCPLGFYSLPAITLKCTTPSA